MRNSDKDSLLIGVGKMYNELIFDYKTYYLDDNNEWVYIRNVLAGVPDKRTLDETLNESGIQINAIELDKPFEPFTKIKRETIDHKTKNVLGTIYSYVASDVVTLMSFVKPLYQHNIVLIEPIKKLERYVCDNLTFRNSLQDKTTPQAVDPIFDTTVIIDEPRITYGWEYIDDTQKYYSPIYTGTQLTILPLKTIYNNRPSSIIISTEITADYVTDGSYITLQINSQDPYNVKVGDSITLSANSNYIIKYHMYDENAIVRNISVDVIFTISTFTKVDKPPIYTITSVCNRIFSLTPTRLANESPLFKLDNTFADNYANIEAPEFTFTQKTLFDSLIEIGKSIQSIPYIKIDPNNDKEWNTIDFEFVGGNRKFKLENEKLSAYNNNWSCEQYCNCIDSTVNNIMPSDVNSQGTVYEPYYESSIAARCDTGMLDENNVEAISQNPIAKSPRFIISGKTIGTTEDYDITDYLYEKTNYDALFEYIKDNNSKAYACYYEYGQKNIKGLYYKAPNPIDPALSRPAIENILEKVTGRKIESISYDKIYYRLEYIPFINTRLRQYKTNINATKHNSTLIYNQQTNIPDSRAYGNNMYGTVARLGNQNPILTYCLTDYTKIPEVGELTTDGYYVSIVELEYWQQFIKCTVTLSKDFNRLSEYVGIKSYERFYEVDPTMALERFVNIDDFAIISTKKYDNNDSFITGGGLLAFINIFYNSKINNEPINFVKIFNKTIENEIISEVALSPSTIAFGNSIVITINYQDNYGATPQLLSYKIKRDDGAIETRLFARPLQYSDIYGNIDNCNIEFTLNAYMYDESTYSYPTATNMVTIGSCFNISNLKLEKDSGEAIAIIYQIHFVSDDNKIVVGNKIAENSSLVGNVNKAPAKIAFLTYKIGAFANKLNPSKTIDINWNDFAVGEIEEKYIKFGTIAAPINCESWAIVDSENNLLFGMNEKLIKEEYTSEIYINFNRNKRHLQ